MNRSMVETLSEREQEILIYLVEGLSNSEIATRLHLAHRTVKWYNSQIYAKLGVNNRKEAIEQAEALGLLGLASDTQVSTSRYNLPVQTTPFIGRQRELADIAKQLAEPDSRLITILASGGMGKTRFALAAAERQVRHFADGVFFVPLAPLSSPDEIVAALADSLGFSFYGSDSPMQQLLNYLRERQALLILDNFEHLLEGASLAADIISAAPKVKIITSSREKLNLTGETVFTLFGMHFLDWETPDDALEYDAVKLFMQSAHRVRSDFVLQVNELQYLANICRLAEGMPLAIVLAAGWLDVLTLKQIAAEMQQGIDILETEMRDVPERQRSIRVSFNYSWNRLSENERAAFMNLSVFRGGFTAEAAQAVAQADVRILRRLAGKALVQGLASGRYDVHELLRQYGAEQLAAVAETKSVQQAHSRYYMAFMAQHDEDIKGRRQQAGLQEIRDDFDNVRQAWLWAAEHRQYEAIGPALDCLTNAAEMNFDSLESQTILQHTVTALQPAAGEPLHPVWDKALVRQERLKFLLNQPIQHEVLRNTLQRARQGADKHEIAYCLWVLGDYAHEMADYEAYSTYYEECLALRQFVGDDFYIAHTFVGISNAYMRRDDFEGYLQCLRESARIRRETGDFSNLCVSLNALGNYLILMANFREAESVLHEALSVQSEIGKVPAYVGVVFLKAELAFWGGEFDRASQLIQAGQDFAGERDYLGLRNLYQALLGWIANMAGDYQRGYTLCQQAASGGFSFSDWGIRASWGMALAQSGMLHNEEAAQALSKVLMMARNNPNSFTFQQLSLPIAAVLIARKDNRETAVELLGLADSAPKELTGWMAHWQVLNNLQTELRLELGAELYADAWARGQTLDLKLVIEALLAEWTQTEVE